MTLCRLVGKYLKYLHLLCPFPIHGRVSVRLGSASVCWVMESRRDKPILDRSPLCRTDSWYIRISFWTKWTYRGILEAGCSKGRRFSDTVWEGCTCGSRCTKPRRVCSLRLRPGVVTLRRSGMVVSGLSACVTRAHREPWPFPGQLVVRVPCQTLTALLTRRSSHGDTSTGWSASADGKCLPHCRVFFGGEVHRLCTPSVSDGNTSGRRGWVTLATRLLVLRSVTGLSRPSSRRVGFT